MDCIAREYGCGCENCRAEIKILNTPDPDWRPAKIAAWAMIALSLALGGLGAAKAVERVNHSYQEVNQ